jgi:hypothetical protein
VCVCEWTSHVILKSENKLDTLDGERNENLELFIHIVSLYCVWLLCRANDEAPRVVTKFLTVFN